MDILHLAAPCRNVPVTFTLERRNIVRPKLIPVLPKNYRHIALHAVHVAAKPVVVMDRHTVTDLSERGPITQDAIRKCTNFEVRDGSTPILGFHDHPNEMWVSEDYAHVADHCASMGWLKVQS